MKITKEQLQQIIKEEISKVIKESGYDMEPRKGVGGALAGFFGTKNKKFGAINGRLYGAYMAAQNASWSTKLHWVKKWVDLRNELFAGILPSVSLGDGGKNVVSEEEEKDLLKRVKPYTTDGKQLKDFMKREHQLRAYMRMAEDIQDRDRERKSDEEKARQKEEWEKTMARLDDEAEYKAYRAAERAEREAAAQADEPYHRKDTWKEPESMRDYVNRLNDR